MKKKVFLISLLILVTVGSVLYVKNILDNAGGRIMVLVNNIEVDRDWKKIDLSKFRFYKKETNVIFFDFDLPKEQQMRESDFLQVEVEDSEGGRCSLHPTKSKLINGGSYFRGDGACFTDPNKYKNLWIKSSVKVNARIDWWGSNDEDMKR